MNSLPAALLRGLLFGLAFGVAAVSAMLWMQLPATLQRGMGGAPAFTSQMASWGLLLGVVLGGVASPVLLLRSGRWLHPWSSHWGGTASSAGRSWTRPCSRWSRSSPRSADCS